MLNFCDSSSDVCAINCSIPYTHESQARGGCKRTKIAVNQREIIVEAFYGRLDRGGNFDF